MSLTNPNKVVTEQRLSEFYGEIFPYLGGTAEAGFTPVGTVIAVMGNSAPANYLACNGQIVNIADYPVLADYFFNQFGSKNKFGGDGTTTFGIPDLRGEFLRGTGTNSHANQGSGANVGVHQDATEFTSLQIGSSTNPIISYADSNDWANVIRSNSDSSIYKNGSVTPIPNKTIKGTYQSSTDTSDRNILVGSYSRPTNTSVLYCIATKNIFLDPSMNYSESECVVGTWVDGKPIYQKVFLNQTHKSGSGQIFNTGITTVSEIILLDMIIDRTGNSFVDDVIYGDNYFNNSAYYGYGFRKSTGELFYNNTGGTTGKFKLIMRYTKTTD